MACERGDEPSSRATNLPIRPAPKPSDLPQESVPPEASANPVAPVAGARPVSFLAADDVSLVGRVWGRGRPAGVILLHDADAGKDQWLELAGALDAAGYAVLAFDFRGYGNSEGQREPAAAPSDVAGAVRLVKAYGSSRVALVGAGLGGTAAVASGNEPEVEAVVAAGAGPKFQTLDASDEARRLKAAALVLDTGAGGAAELARLIADARLREVSGGPTGTAARTAILSFLKDVLKP